MGQWGEEGSYHGNKGCPQAYLGVAREVASICLGHPLAGGGGGVLLTMRSPRAYLISLSHYDIKGNCTMTEHELYDNIIPKVTIAYFALPKRPAEDTHYISINLFYTY